MHPVLFTIPGFRLFGHQFGEFSVRSYGLMLVIGIVLAVWWSQRRAARWGIAKDRVLDAMLWGVIPGVLGARLGYIVQEWGFYSQNVSEIFTWKFAGLTSFGGVIMAVLGLIVYARRAKLPALAFLDVVSAPLLVAHAVGRVGCLLNGCCYGHKTTAWYGVHVETAAGLFEPAQVYEGFLVMVGVGLLMLFEKKLRPFGTSFAFALIAWGAARFVYEFFRAGTVAEVEKGVASSTYWGSLPITQAHAAAFVLIVAGAFMMWRVAQTPRPEPIGATE